MNRTCSECRGTGISRLFSGRCAPCRGLGETLLSVYLQTHEGVCALAEALSKGDLTMEEIETALKCEVPDRTLERMRGIQALERIPTFAKNPCVSCGSFQLRKEWIGSGFCSRACCEAQGAHEDETKRAYAESIMECWRLRHDPEYKPGMSNALETSSAEVAANTISKTYPVLVEVNGRSYNLTQAEMDCLWDAYSDNRQGLAALAAWIETYGFRLEEIGLVVINRHNCAARLSAEGSAVVAAHRNRAENVTLRMKSRGVRATLREPGTKRSSGEIVIAVDELEKLLSRG